MEARMRLVQHIAFSKSIRSAHRIVCQKLKPQKPLLKCRNNNNNKMYIKRNVAGSVE
jgi:hypothetical protein